MSLRSERQGEATTVFLAGDFTIEQAPAIRRELLQALRGTRRLQLDCADVQRIDSAGLAVLVEVLQRARAQNADLLLQRQPEGVRRLLRLTRLDSLFGPAPLHAPA